MIEEHDNVQHWRCPQLGGPVPFSYCRNLNSSLPCPRVVECWSHHNAFDIVAFLKSNYSEEQLLASLKPLGGRLDTILNTIDRISNPKDES